MTVINARREKLGKLENIYNNIYIIIYICIINLRATIFDVKLINIYADINS